MNRPGWTREPLVHFLIAGAFLFALFMWRGEEADPASRSIAVDRDRQAQIALLFERTMGRAPTDAELDAQIERFVRSEVLYREALRLGLDQDDAVVRNRLASKMDMAASAAVEAVEPDDEVLRQWLADNAERYSSPDRFSFDQLYFENEAAAKSALVELTGNARSGTAGKNDWQKLGEPISLPASFEKTAPDEIAERFGQVFAKAMLALEPEFDGVQNAAASQAGISQSGASQTPVWQGPIQSGFGWHLVRLRARAPVKARDFAEIRPQLVNDWRSAQIAARKDAAYKVLRDAYVIDIDR